MHRSALVLAAAGLGVAALVAPSAGAAGTDTPPAEHLRASTVLPPGENGDFTADEQAQYEADGDPNDFGPHVDDQREMYWAANTKPADFQAPTGPPVEPKAGIRIYRDAAGVPLIYADTGEDVWYGAGYAAATDRLFEIDAIRRTARGTLAELTGPGGVPADLQERILTYTDAEYDAMLDRLSPAGQEAIRGYAAGVQQRIDEVQADPSLLPAE